MGKDPAKDEWTLRFPLASSEPDSPPLHDDERAEFVRRELAALLDLVILCKDGRPIQADGFKFIADLRASPDWTYAIFPSAPRDGEGPATQTKDM